MISTAWLPIVKGKAFEPTVLVAGSSPGGLCGAKGIAWCIGGFNFYCFLIGKRWQKGG